MDSFGKLFEKGEPTPKSYLFTAYEELARGGFKEIDDALTDEDLMWIQRIHDKYLSFYKEERRMHFGAFALAGLAFIILFPPLLTVEEHFLPLVGVEALLLVLLVPYIFVYRRYEEGVRRMMREAIVIENIRRCRVEKND